MSAKSFSNESLSKISTRVSGLETRVNGLESGHKDIGEKMMRFSINQDNQTNSINDLKTQSTKLQMDLEKQMADGHHKTQKFIEDMFKEFSGPFDKLINAFGLNDDIDAPRELKQDMAYVRDRRLGSSALTKQVKGILVNAVVYGLIAIFMLGMGVWIAKQNVTTQVNVEKSK